MEHPIMRIAIDITERYASMYRVMKPWQKSGTLLTVAEALKQSLVYTSCTEYTYLGIHLGDNIN